MAAQDNTDLFVRDLSAQPIAADQKRVARFSRVWTLEINVHRRMRTKRARDHVLWNVRGHIGFGHLAGSRHFPHEAVIESKLFQQFAAEPIHTAIPYVSDERALRQEHKAAASRPHAVKANAALPLGMDRRIRFANRLAECGWRIKIAELEIGMRYVVDRKLTGQLARRMCAHAVSNDHQMTTSGPCGDIIRHH